MRLLLVRHGDANPPTLDPNKGLSQKGKEQTEEVAAHLMKMGLQIDQVWHSPKKRAKETAMIIASAYSNQPPLYELVALSPDGSSQEVFDLVKHEQRTLCLVTHLPLIDALASLLLFGHPDSMAVNFTCSTIVCLVPEGDYWKIDHLIQPQWHTETT